MRRRGSARFALSVVRGDDLLKENYPAVHAVGRAAVEVRFEGSGTLGTTVQGHLHEARVTVLSGSDALARHLNKHIDYQVTPAAEGVKESSVSQPSGIAVSSLTLAENNAVGAVVGTLTAVDPDVGGHG